MNTAIEGKKVRIERPRSEVYKHLSDPGNFGDIMPDDVVKFEAGDDWFIFGLKGIPEVKLKIDKLSPEDQIVLKSASDKLQFELIANFEALGEATEAQLHFKGNFNPMLKMMVTRPLTNFMEKLSDKLKGI